MGTTTWPEFNRNQEGIARLLLEDKGWRFAAEADGRTGVADELGHKFEADTLREAIHAIERIALEHVRKDARRCSACGKTVCADCRTEDIEMHRGCEPG